MVQTIEFLIVIKMFIVEKDLSAGLAVYVAATLATMLLCVCTEVVLAHKPGNSQRGC
jgi:hypothetical protein